MTCGVCTAGVSSVMSEPRNALGNTSSMTLLSPPWRTLRCAVLGAIPQKAQSYFALGLNLLMLSAEEFLKQHWLQSLLRHCKQQPKRLSMSKNELKKLLFKGEKKLFSTKFFCLVKSSFRVAND